MASWIDRIRNIISPPKQTTVVKTIPQTKIIGRTETGSPAPIAGDTPSGYVGGKDAPKPTPGKTTTVTYSRGGGGSSSRTITTSTPTPSYASDKLQMTFQSAEARAKAEAQYDAQQKAIAQQRAQQEKEIASRKLTGQIESKTSVPSSGLILDVRAAPTTRQTYQSFVERGGYIKGSLSFAGAALSSGIEKIRQKSIRDSPELAPYFYYQAPAVSKIAETAPTGAYFVPVLGPTLLVAGGGESLLTSSGRGRLTETSQFLQEERGWSKPLAQTVAYGQPVVEILGGGAALKSQVSNIVTARRLAALEKQPTAITGLRVEKGKEGIDYLVGAKTTKYADYRVKVEQPFFRTDTQTVFESGKATALVRTGKTVKAAQFDVMGRSVASQTPPRVVSTRGGITTRTDVIGLRGATGQLVIKKTGAIDAKVTPVYSPLKGDLILRGKGTATAVSETTTIPFVGVSKGDKVIQVFGGTAKGARYYPATGKITVTTQPTQVGIIQRVTLPDASSSSGIFSQTTGTILKTKPVTQLQYADELASQIFKATASTTAVRTYPIFSPTITRTQSPITTTTQVTGNQILEPTTKTTRDVIQTTTPIVGITQTTRTRAATRTTQRPRTDVIQTPTTLTEPVALTQTKTATTQITKSRLKQQLAQAPAIPTMGAPLGFIPKFPFVPFIPPAPLLAGFKTARKKAQRRRQPFKYQPSFTASSLGITTRTQPTSKLLGGLMLRPVISKKKPKNGKDILGIKF